MNVPTVTRDDASAAFFDGTARGEFLLQRDRRTGAFREPQTEILDPDDIEFVPASGGGKVVSWSVVHHRAPGGSGEEVRDVVGIVELDEGPWWWTRLVVDAASEPTDLTGRRVRLVWARPEGEAGETLPAFEVVADAAPDPADGA